MQINGFVDIVWTLSDGTDEGVNGDEGHFSTSGEIDVQTALKGPISLRMDADLNPSPSGGADSGRLEQAFLTWDIQNNINLKAGVFNNNLSWEKEDAPDMYQVTHGLLWDVWNQSTVDLDGNNITGLELAYSADIFTLMVGFLNDIGGVAEENSVKFAGEIRAMPNLNVVVGLITQDAGLENIIDVNATWTLDDKLTIGGEIMMPDEIVVIDLT